MHKACDLLGQLALRCVGSVAGLPHVRFNGCDFLQGEKGEHAQEFDDLLVADRGKEILVELER